MMLQMIFVAVLLLISTASLTGSAVLASRQYGEIHKWGVVILSVMATALFLLWMLWYHAFIA